MVPDLVAVIALDFDMGSTRLATGATGPFEFAGEILEKGRVSGQALDDRYRLPLAARLLDPEPSSDPIRYGLIHFGGAATALLRPTALRTHPTLVSGIDGTWFPALAHDLQLTFGILSCHPGWIKNGPGPQIEGLCPRFGNLYLYLHLIYAIV